MVTDKKNGGRMLLAAAFLAEYVDPKTALELAKQLPSTETSARDRVLLRHPSLAARALPPLSLRAAPLAAPGRKDRMLMTAVQKNEEKA